MCFEVSMRFEGYYFANYVAVVFTTGTTLSECAKTLKKAGASSVHAMSVARALPD
jgi:predicted amidophosphoribosyltransferase